MTVEEIRAEYAAKIKAAGEDELAALRMMSEMNIKISELYGSQLQENQVSNWKRDAINKFPRARAEELRGGTVEEVEASAKASHDHVEKILGEEKARIEEELKNQLGQRMYGAPTAGGAQGQPPTNQQNVQDARRKVDEEIGEVVKKGGRISDEAFHRQIAAHMEKIAERIEV